MRYSVLLVILLCELSHAQLDINTELKSNQLAPDLAVRCVVTPSQIYPCTHLTQDGISFLVGYDMDSNRVKYLSTRDKKFKIGGNLHVGDWIELRQDQIFVIEGWKFFGPTTKDGWRIVLGTAFNGEKTLTLADGSRIDVSKKSDTPSKLTKVRIMELEKGGV